MYRRQGSNWGLKAAACAGIVVWQFYEIVNSTVFTPNESNYLRYLAIAAALFGLVASLVKHTSDY